MSFCCASDKSRDMSFVSFANMRHDLQSIKVERWWVITPEQDVDQRQWSTTTLSVHHDAKKGWVGRAEAEPIQIPQWYLYIIMISGASDPTNLAITAIVMVIWRLVGQVPRSIEYAEFDKPPTSSWTQKERRRSVKLMSAACRRVIAHRRPRVQYKYSDLLTDWAVMPPPSPMKTDKRMQGSRSPRTDC